jgi:hypothetical protein
MERVRVLLIEDNPREARFMPKMLASEMKTHFEDIWRRPEQLMV